MRSLSAEESALWSRVAATIRPLSRDKDDTTATTPPAVAASKGKSTVAPQVQRAPLAPAHPVSGNTLDGSWDRRLKSGSVEPDRTVDLHSMSLDQAWRAIDDSLDEAIARGDRLLLLITGHQRSGEPPIRRGAIRAAVYDWLAASRHAGEIAAVRGAHRRHGGGGSLYIVLRRNSRSR